MSRQFLRTGLVKSITAYLGISTTRFLLTKHPTTIIKERKQSLIASVCCQVFLSVTDTVFKVD